MAIDKITTDGIADDAVAGSKIAMGSDAAGDILTFDGTSYTRLPKGTAGQILRMNASATGLEWADNPVELVSYTEPSDAASVEFTTGFSANHDVYEIYYEFVPATNGANLHLLYSTDAGSTYKTGASDYRYTTWGKQDNSLAPQAFSTASAFILLNAAHTIGNAAGRGISGNIRLIRPASTAIRTFATFESSFVDTNGNTFHQHGNGSYNTNTAVNALKLQFSAGNMTGKVQFRRLANNI